MVCLHSLILQLILMRKLCLEIEKLNWFSKTRRLKILSTYLVSISKSMAQKGSYQQGTRKLGRKPEPKKSGPGRVSRARYQKTRKTRVGFRVFLGIFGFLHTLSWIMWFFQAKKELLCTGIPWFTLWGHIKKPQKAKTA